MRYSHCNHCGSRNRIGRSRCGRCLHLLPLGMIRRVLVSAIVLVTLVLVILTLS